MTCVWSYSEAFPSSCLLLQQNSRKTYMHVPPKQAVSSSEYGPTRSSLNYSIHIYSHANPIEIKTNGSFIQQDSSSIIVVDNDV